MKLIMTKGLPGSGKTTWAKQYQNDHKNYKVVNKDTLRFTLDDSKWSGLNEKFVLLTRDIIVLSALQHGFSVIIDDTNLAPKHELHLRELAKVYDAQFIVQDFTGVSLEACIAQDLKRLNSVGKDVIMKMYHQFLKPAPKLVPYDSNLPNCIICDLDGTLALFGDANPYDRDFSKDIINDTIALIVEKWDDVDIFIVSGRKDTFRDQTLAWLKKADIPFDMLKMRKADDNRKDAIVKREIYEENIKNEYNVLFVLDDRNQVVEMWRSLGLTCLQVADGDF